MVSHYQPVRIHSSTDIPLRGCVQLTEPARYTLYHMLRSRINLGWIGTEILSVISFSVHFLYRFIERGLFL